MEVSNTKKPPIELTSHFFTQVSLVADINALPSILAQKEVGYRFKMDVDIAPPNADREDYQVTLRIETEECEGLVKAYDALIEVVGFVLVDQSIPEEGREQTAGVLGSSLLYGAAREYLYTLSLRGPYPAIYLPTTSFIPNERKEETEAPPSTEETKAPSQAAKKKSKRLPKDQ